uniref:NADH:ubiquinone reductase (H(+)-translocating) n=1 Tax=Longicollum sp. (in: thorny-headed worms) TaxID=3073164 RepID=A0AA49K486_9BILA|nr:NADH dehydrogenase subunit 5 [Longicollum sp. (in: thorny-headed worms)]
MLGVSGVINLVLVVLVMSVVMVFLAGQGVMVVLDGFIGVKVESMNMGSGLSMGGYVSVLLLVVGVVSAMVVLFSSVYMIGDSEGGSFILYVYMFIGGMFLLVSAYGSYWGLLGWEFLGVISFMLIGYYGTRVAWGGAFVTMAVNRVGDVAMILVVMVGLVSSGLLGGGVSSNGALFVGVGVLLLVVTKSSQFPCSGWLPLAMAAPTPVSALVHSSTLVIAGVVMAVYLEGIYGWSSGVLGWLVVMGTATLVSSSLSIIWEMDFKKVVALSTSIHLALMVLMLVEVGSRLVLSHMSFHAMFKSLLFVAVGLVILMSSHDQDHRGVMGGSGYFGAVGVVVLSSVWSLVGLMGFSGWVSKDFFMESVLMGGGEGLMWLLCVLVVLSVSVVYSVKLLFMFSEGGPLGVVTGLGWKGSSALAVVMVAMGVISSSLGVMSFNLLDGSEGVGVMSAVEKNLYWGLALLALALVYVFGSGSKGIAGGMFFLQDLYQGALGFMAVVLVCWVSKGEELFSASTGSGVEGLMAGVMKMSAGAMSVVDLWGMVGGLVVVMSGALMVI